MRRAAPQADSQQLGVCHTAVNALGSSRDRTRSTSASLARRARAAAPHWDGNMDDPPNGGRLSAVSVGV